MTTQSAVPATKGGQVPLKEKISYAFAEFGSQFIWTTVGSYLLAFYTNVALIPAVTAGNILLLARILDGVQDLGFGYIAERTKSRWGRFRPYVIFGAPAVSITMILAFVNPFDGSGAKTAWAAITYVLLCFAYTVANMAYGSLAGVMTTDSGERLTLNWIRNIGSQAAQLIMNVLTPFLLAAFVINEAGKESGGDTRSYLITMAIYGLIALPMFLITGFNVRERITMTPEQQQVSFKDTVKAVLSNGQLMVVFFTLLLNLVGLFGRIGVMYIYCIYILGNPTLMAGVMSVFTLGAAIGTIVLPPFALKLGKRNMMMVSMLCSAVFLFAIFIVGDSHGLTLLLVLQFCYGLSGFAAPIALSMVPDAVDYYELKTGVRADGTSYAAVSLSTKIASAVGGAISLYIIGFFGYDGAAKVQTATALTGINVATNLMPAIMAFVAFIPLLFWKLSTKRMNEITAELDVKRAAQAEALAEGLSRDEAEQVAEHAAEEAVAHPGRD
ncbi:glycoside-pentoside-hexuronide (GPH):cation symporter [Actinomyces sp. MRS3W]|uniref:MFS transporter n=1 Tax=Actinomyces sp. MRS3W TaxID=2800796 RepID=UPI0028FD20A0|nr:glycoside-pentoside-hexuronide (GPH):cation symporter [Actinomyces sp. MRS3W]MDU0347970.1 glycoside-pentoside-hexuronide (GPH):cation symporter [Actinomyces sp. MRS3W]